MAHDHRILDISFPTGSTLFLQHRVVRLTTAGAVVHTTGASTLGNIRAFGVTQDAPTASTSSTGTTVPVRVLGVSKVEASTAAITAGQWVRPTTGAVASTSRLGGTVIATTDQRRKIGVALDGVAAGTGKRLVSILLK